ncbi:hypothetical protein J1614_000869 [Plenodomus biglobosus]|nr:hypothetical protein J1614_000869 [Plenodomus biglobosus]
MSSTCTRDLEQRSDASATINASALFEQRHANSGEEDRARLRKCWGYTDCGDCHRSEGNCGWCAISGTCLPLPRDPMSRAFPLLSPIRHKTICALSSERFELRTSGLGCQVSTITFLTSLVTIVCTILGVAVLYGLVKFFRAVGRALRAQRGGYVLHEDGSGETWVRKGESWSRWWRRIRGQQEEFAFEEVDGEATPQRPKRWNGLVRGGKATAPGNERTRLLGS